jgi:hypothetical protein
VPRNRLDAEAPDADWVNAEADRRREIFDAAQQQHARDRQATRKALPRFERLRLIEVQLMLASGTRAAGFDQTPISTSKPGATPPPRQSEAFGGENERDVARLFRLVTATIERLEQLSDARAGRSDLISEDIDKMLAQHAGMPAADVSALDDRFGSPAAVRAARRRLELSAELGEPLTPRPAPER